MWIDELVADASALFVPRHHPALCRMPRCCETFCCRLERADQSLDGNCLGRKAVEQLDAQRLAQHA